LHLLGLIALNAGNPRRAIEMMTKVIQVDPRNAAAFCNRAAAHQQLAESDRALEDYDRAIAAQGDFAEAYFGRAMLLRRLRSFDAALDSYDRAIALRPDYLEAHINRGNVCRDLQRWDAALASYDRAIRIDSRCAEAHALRGNIYNELNRLDEAMANYDQAIAIKADYVDAYCSRAVAQLLAGDFENGWVNYEWRRRRHAALPQALWLGKEPLAGKSILLHGEQGFGDTLQFCRYATLVAELGASVVLQVQETLLGLMAGLRGVSQVIAKGAPLPEVDFQCPLLSLPLAFKTRLASIPAEAKYLHADERKRAHWQARLGARNRLRIGLAWAGSTMHTNNNRAVPLCEAIGILPRDADYVVLQKEILPADRDLVQAQLKGSVFTDELVDFSETAALCECMDLIISIDTSVAHLGGALGLPSWILLPFNPDWRWLLGRDDSPWYPSARLYRQPELNDWRTPLAKLRGDLDKLLSTAPPAQSR
jgi:lipoprotein NlpI